MFKRKVLKSKYHGRDEEALYLDMAQMLQFNHHRQWHNTKVVTLYVDFLADLLLFLPLSYAIFHLPNIAGPRTRSSHTRIRHSD